MARVTVEDCIEKVPNRFELVMLAVQRSRDIAAGAHPSIPRDGDKNPVIALREIADSTINQDVLWVELETYFHTPEALDAAEEEVAPEALLPGSPDGDEKAAPAEASEASDSGETVDATANESGAETSEESKEQQWSEEDMLRALREMEGEPSP